MIPLSIAFPPGQNVQQQNAENAQLMTDSQKDAVAAALNELGYHFAQRIVVKQVANGPAKGVIEVGDVITAVNGATVKGVQSLRDQLAKNGAGTTATISIVRGGKKQDVTVTPEKTAGSVVIGIGASMDYTFPFDVTIQLNNVGGPSAGLMMALSVYDTLTEGSLTDNKKIAGTGTIDGSGNVGPIGGIQQKIPGAASDGAKLFLVPAGNCQDVEGAANGDMRLTRVETLDDAIKAIETWTEDPNAKLPTCGSTK